MENEFPRKAIGARAIISWWDDKEPMHVFISFAEPTNGGIADSKVFYYSNEKEVEDIFCSVDGHTEGWNILEYTLICDMEDDIL